MPFRKSYRKRKASKRSYGRRKFTLRRPVRRAGMSKIHHFKQKCDLAPITWGSNGGTQTGFYMFRLSDLPQWSTFQSLFDSYRINKVVLKFFPRYSRNPIGTNYPYAVSGTTAGYFGQFLPQAGRIYHAVDYTGIPAITTDTQIQEYGNCKINAFTRPFTRIITPSVTNYPYAVTASEGSANPTVQQGVELQPRWKQWLSFPFDSDTTESTPHMSLLWWIDSIEEEDSGNVPVESAFDNAVAYDVSATYYFSVRAIR